jgi:hypothetical protein
MIHVATPDFDFSKIHLSTPVATTSGSYFTKINYTASEESLYIYTPKCTTKGGVQASGTKRYLDLSFTAANSAIIEWAQGLEDHLQKEIYAKRSAWFTDELEMDDIQTVFIPIVKPCKGGQYVVRAYVNQGRAKFPALPQVYDSNETPLSIDDVHADSTVITILDVQGIKFTSRSFTVVVSVKQIMVLQDVTVFNQCMIRSRAPPAVIEDEVVATQAIQVQAVAEPPAAAPPAEPPAPPPPSEKEIAYRIALEQAQALELEAAESLRKAKELKDALNLDA